MPRLKKKPAIKKPKTRRQLGKMAKIKGATAELEVAKLFQDRGYNARRTAQYCGKSGDASDVVVDEFLEAHVEVKRVETLSLYTALEQMVEDNVSQKPLEILFHRRNQKNWVCIVPEETFFLLLKGYEMAKEKLTTAQMSQLAKKRIKPADAIKQESSEPQIEVAEKKSDEENSSEVSTEEKVDNVVSLTEEVK